ncbi:hypothetical protein [Alcaligenes faecalis]|uniref:hypothetical protein n=1 Tax=Alcaligenes faecalis TaxID=511 RepID=UPI001C83819E|nr:hypothetical protein [Alcaligenes faecalis]MBX6965991.1 hypothetical protein [Providencia rettgeri]MBX7031206.1 hypothetical protein [Alcaligenes faecalis]
MSRLVSSLGQLVGALVGLALIVVGLASMATNTGPGGLITLVCGVLLLPRIFPKFASKFKSQHQFLIGIALVVFSLVAGTIWIGDPREKETAADRYVAAIDERRDQERSRCSDTIMAYVMSQDFVKTKLVAPATAKFPPFSDVKVTKLGECKFTVLGYVDSQNSFGAMLRATYSANVRYDRQSGKWALESLAM